MKKFFYTLAFVFSLFFIFNKTVSAEEVGGYTINSPYCVFEDRYGHVSYIWPLNPTNDDLYFDISYFKFRRVSDDVDINTASYWYVSFYGKNIYRENSARPDSFYNDNHFCTMAECPVFTNVSNAKLYYSTGDESYAFYLPSPSISFDPFDYEYDSSVPTPNLTMDKNYRISFVNGSDALGIVSYVRWKSYSNINIYNSSDIADAIFHPITTLNSYSFRGDLLTSNLYEVISVEDGLWSSLGFDLYGNYPSDPSEISNSFTQFLSDHPVSSRPFSYGNNLDLNDVLVPSSANKFALQLKNALSLPNSKLNSPEVYFRYYVLDDSGVPHFGKWSKLTIPLGSVTDDYSTNSDLIYGTENNSDYTISTNGINNDGVIDDDGSGDNLTINPNTGSPVIDWNINSPNFNTGIQNFRQALGLFGNFQQFVALVYSMLPPWMIVLMGSTITMLCGLAVYHGIRG